MKKTLIVALLFTTAGFSATVKRIDLKSNFRFASADFGCDNFIDKKSLSIALEVEGKKLLRAKLANAYGASEKTSLLLEADEVAQVKWGYDLYKAAWLSELPATPRIVEWFMHHATLGASDACKPPEPLATLNYTDKVYKFDLQSVNAGLSFSDSQLIRFNGTLKSGKAFSAELSLSQGL